MRIVRYRHLAVVAGAIAATFAYGWVASGTRPFTVGADSVTAMALGLGAVAATLTGLGVFGSKTRTGGPPSEARPAVWPWLVSLGILVLWELAVYWAGVADSRHVFPTLSSLYDDAARWRGTKATFFALWLLLGFGLFVPSGVRRFPSRSVTDV